MNNICTPRSEGRGMPPPTPAGREPPPRVCRRPGCDGPAAEGSDFCTDHGLHYVRWRAHRDELEQADLHGTDRAPGDDLEDDPGMADALDILHRFLTRRPFE
jgi:hypothetical protein